MTLYKKVGKRYKKFDDFYEDRGLPIGLYLFYKPDSNNEHSAMMNMSHYTRVHNIKEVGNFSDIWIKYEEEISSIIRNELSTNHSINEMTINIVKLLSEKIK